MANTITYKIGDILYVNVTNRCTNCCSFCIRTTPAGIGGGLDLWLEHEPSVEEIKQALQTSGVEGFKEVVFCGYGEPLMRFDDVMKVCGWLRENYSSCHIRINTNGHANEVCGRDVTPQLKGKVDVISISLNAANAVNYEKVCQSDYGEQGFDIMLDFAKRALRYVERVVLSVVDVMDAEEIEECRTIAQKIGAEFRIRQYSE